MGICSITFVHEGVESLLRVVGCNSFIKPELELGTPVNSWVSNVGISGSVYV